MKPQHQFTLTEGEVTTTYLSTYDNGQFLLTHKLVPVPLETPIQVSPLPETVDRPNGTWPHQGSDGKVYKRLMYGNDVSAEWPIKIHTRYGKTEIVDDRVVLAGYKGQIDDHIDNENQIAYLNYHVVDNEGVSLRRTVDLKNTDDLLSPPEFEFKTNEGITLFYQEPGLYFSELGVFYYTRPADVGFFYAPYVPLMHFNKQKMVNEQRSQLYSMFDPETVKPPPRIVR